MLIEQMLMIISAHAEHFESLTVRDYTIENQLKNSSVVCLGISIDQTPSKTIKSFISIRRSLTLFLFHCVSQRTLVIAIPIANRCYLFVHCVTGRMCICIALQALKRSSLSLFKRTTCHTHRQDVLKQSTKRHRAYHSDILLFTIEFVFFFFQLKLCIDLIQSSVVNRYGRFSKNS